MLLYKVVLMSMLVLWYWYNSRKCCRRLIIIQCRRHPPLQPRLHTRPFMYSPMLAQVRTVRKALPTLLAHVRFRTLMHIHMARQRRLDRETLPTLRAHMLPSLRMRRLVILQLLLRHKRPVAARIRARMRLVVRVAVDVSCEFGLVTEGLGFGAAGPVAVVVASQ